MKYKIDKCNNSDYTKLTRAITHFNLQQLPADIKNDTIPVGFVIREHFKGLVGGIVGKLLLGNCLTIDILWVEAAHREQGYGRELLLALEEDAKVHGSKLSIVDTFDFQALDFYKKNGYTEFGKLEDCPCEGHIRYYLSKKL